MSIVMTTTRIHYNYLYFQATQFQTHSCQFSGIFGITISVLYCDNIYPVLYFKEKAAHRKKYVEECEGAFETHVNLSHVDVRTRETPLVVRLSESEPETRRVRGSSPEGEEHRMNTWCGSQQTQLHNLSSLE